MKTLTFEYFDIRWDRGSTWSPYDTAAEAQATIDFAKSKSGSTGHVVRVTFDVVVPSDFVPARSPIAIHEHEVSA